MKLTSYKPVTGAIVVGDIYLKNMGAKVINASMTPDSPLELDTVDILSFLNSERHGMIAQYLKAKSVVPVEQNVSELTYSNYQTYKDATRAVESREVAFRHEGIGGVVMLEPGASVYALGQQANTGPQPKPENNPKLEGFSVNTATPPTVGASPEKADSAPSKGNLVVEEAATPTTWKTGLTLEQQEDKITASEDKKFLQDVSTDKDETARNKRLASKRLDALS